MSNGAKCKECGTVLRRYAPGGLCRKCLFGLGLEPNDDLEASGLRPEPTGPSPESDFDSPGAGAESPAGTAKPTSVAWPPTEEAGDTIGPYKLIKRLGEGGFGVVYLAEQREPLKRGVALKIIKIGMDTKQVVARFEAERQALALMDHPNIAKVLDAGAAETGRPYFVMELVHGIKVTDYCDQHSLPTRERLELFVQICRAIQHAHQKGIIHRDIKPSNILVTINDGVPVPKVIDFGIAKATGGLQLTDKTMFTAFEQFLGTPAYMSPEQAELSSVDIDTRSDIYSLGVLVYELLTGKTPFDSKQLLQVGLDEMRRTIREKEPVRPSTRVSTLSGEELTTTARERGLDGPKLISHLRGDLDWIVMKCLEKDRARRYETANGLARDIERHLNNEPVVAGPRSRLYEFQKSVRRHKIGFAATGAVIAALGFGLVVSAWDVVRVRRAEREQGRLLVLTEQANRNAQEKLWASYLAEARAGRYSGQAGQRFESLAALSNAAAIRPSLELRNEAIACLALADIRFLPTKEKRFKHLEEFANVDPALQRYAVGGRDGTVSIRRLSDDQELKRLPAIAGPVQGWIHFSPAGDQLLVSYADSRMRFWDLGLSKVVLETPRVPFTFRSDGSLVALLEDRSITLYDFASRQKLKTIKLEGAISNLGPFDPSGGLLAIHGEDGTEIAVLDLVSEHVLAKLVHPMPVSASVWHPGGRFLASACHDNLIYIWDTVTGHQVRTLRGHKGTPVSLAISRDGSLLVSGGWDGRTRLWDFGSDRELVSIPAGRGISFGADDRTLAGRGWDLEWLGFFEVSHEKQMWTLHETGLVPGPPGGSACLSADGRLVAYDTIEGVALFDVQKQREVAALKQDLVLWGFTGADKTLILADSKGRIFRWAVGEATATDTATTASKAELVAQGMGTGGSLAANGKICANTSGQRCQILQTDTFTEIARTGVEEGMRFLSVSPEGDLVATGPFHGAGVKVWDARTAKLVKALPSAGVDEITTVAFSPDGRWLVTGTAVEYQFWAVGTWSPGLRIEQQPSALFPPVMAFSPDGRILAGSFGFTTVRLFDALTGQILGDLQPPNPWSVTSLSFSGDGTQVLVCEGRNALRLWDLRTIREQLACMHLDWNLPPYAPKAPPLATK